MGIHRSILTGLWLCVVKVLQLLHVLCSTAAAAFVVAAVGVGSFAVSALL